MYNYVAYVNVASTYFNTPTYEKDQLVWVLSSSGRRGKKKNKKDKGDPSEDDADADDNDDADEDERGVRTHLFLRARVVSDPGCSKQPNGNTTTTTAKTKNREFWYVIPRDRRTMYDDPSSFRFLNLAF